MKQFLSFVQKEFYHIFRDKRTIMILLGMPVIQIILFGFAITTEVKNAQVAVFDPSKDISTAHIIERIQASEYFKIQKIVDKPDDINDIFKEGIISLVIVFGENFNENLMHTGEAALQLIIDGSDPNQAGMLTGYVSNIITSYQQELMREYTIPIQIIPEIRMLYNPQMKSAFNFVPGVMGLILMLICAMMTSISIVREKETGTMEILLVSPVKPIYIILAKTIPYLVLSIVNLATILLLSVYVLGVPVTGNLFWLMLVSFIFIIVALSLGMLISTLVDSQVAAMLISGMGLMMPVILLSGMIFPIESMAKILQWISNIIPARWYIASVRKLMIAGVPVVHAIKEIVILIAMATLLITISLKKFKVRLDN